MNASRPDSPPATSPSVRLSQGQTARESAKLMEQLKETPNLGMEAAPADPEHLRVYQILQSLLTWLSSGGKDSVVRNVQKIYENPLCGHDDILQLVHHYEVYLFRPSMS